MRRPPAYLLLSSSSSSMSLWLFKWLATHYHQCGQCLGFRVAPQMIHVLLPMRLNTRSQFASAGKAEYTGNASGYLCSLVRQNSIMLNRFRPSSPFTIPNVRSDFCIVSYSTLRSTSTMSDSSYRANPGADSEGTTPALLHTREQCAALS